MILVSLIRKWLKQNDYFGLGPDDIYFTAGDSYILAHSGAVKRMSKMVLDCYGTIALVYSDCLGQNEAFVLTSRNSFPEKKLYIESPSFFDELREHIEYHKKKAEDARELSKHIRRVLLE